MGIIHQRPLSLCLGQDKHQIIPPKLALVYVKRKALLVSVVTFGRSDRSVRGYFKFWPTKSWK
jgi:hypothetical protein